MRYFCLSRRQTSSVNSGTSRATCQGGFTLVELMVTVTIATVITSVALMNHSQFTSQTVLTNLAYEVAGSIRLAQTYGISVREETSGGSGEFESGYGIHFTDTNTTGYVLFEDADTDGTYDGAGEALRTFQMQNGHTIAEFCARRISTGTTHCNSGPLNYLDITFVRPEPDANFDTNMPLDYDEAWIDVTSAQGTNTRRIRVTPTGHLTVETP